MDPIGTVKRADLHPSWIPYGLSNAPIYFQLRMAGVVDPIGTVKRADLHSLAFASWITYGLSNAPIYFQLRMAGSAETPGISTAGSPVGVVGGVSPRSRPRYPTEEPPRVDPIGTVKRACVWLAGSAETP